MTQPVYRKLTGRRRRLTGYSQLWMGDDHLLLVRSARLVENYQRFALKDILALVISDGPDFRMLQALAIVAGLGWASLALAVSSTFGRGFFMITGFGVLALAIVDIWRGPRCRCVLHTAVSKELLSPVSRRNSSWTFLSQVLPAIEAVQGPADVAQLQAASTNPAAVAEPEPPEVKHERSYVAEILFGLLALSAALVWVVLRTSIPNTAALLPTIYLAELVIAGVMVSQRRAMNTALLVLGILTLVLVVADIATVSGIAAFAAVMNSARINETPQELRSFWFSNRTTAIVATSWRLGVAAVGGALCYFDRRRSHHGKLA
jgi:hypothetical protein